MSNIQIDTKSLELVIYHQFNNIKLSFFSNHMKRSFSLCTFNRCCTVIRYFRVAGCAKLQKFNYEFFERSELSRTTAAKDDE